MLENGYEIIDKYDMEIPLDVLAEELSQFDLEACKGGIRNIDKKSASVFSFCNSSSILDFVSNYLSAQPKLVRAIYFNKTPSNNWLVSWHQDRTVAVSHKFESDEWGPWTIKDGVHHVQPPLSVLEKMVTLRIHIDPSSPENGCLKLVPNSHKLGILTQEQITNITSAEEHVECSVESGAVLIMRPHLLHSSSKAAKPNNRRVLHLEYSSYDLPNGIRWA